MLKMKFFRISPAGKLEEVPFSQDTPLVVSKYRPTDTPDVLLSNQIQVINSPWDIFDQPGEGIIDPQRNIWPFYYHLLQGSGKQGLIALLARMITYSSWADFVQAIEEGAIPFDPLHIKQFLRETRQHERRKST
jgi:hypothetical protein